MAKCFLCGSEVIWQCDYAASELFDLEEGQEDYLVSNWHCPNCNIDYTLYEYPDDTPQNNEEDKGAEDR